MCIRGVTYITMRMKEAGHSTIKTNPGNFWETDSRRKKASFLTVIKTVKLWSYYGVGKTKVTLTFVIIDTVVHQSNVCLVYSKL